MFIAGIDIGGTMIKAGLVEAESGVLTVRCQFPFDAVKGMSGTAADIRMHVDEMCVQQGVQTAELAGIGISVPGSISADGSMVLDAYNLNFHNVPIREEIQKAFPELQRTAILNDANAAAMAELNNGVFTGCQTAIMLTLGTGIGGGIILNGKLFNGGNGSGTEPGHVILNYDGELCTCGNRGCVETLCASGWLIRQGQNVCRTVPDSLISRKAGGSPSQMNAKIVIDAAKEGDAEALKIFHAYLDQLSSAIASYIAILDPEVIGIGGGVANAGDFLFQPLRALVAQKNFFRREYPILHARYGNTAGIIGAAEMIRQAI